MLAFLQEGNSPAVLERFTEELLCAAAQYLSGDRYCLSALVLSRGARVHGYCDIAGSEQLPVIGDGA